MYIIQLPDNNEFKPDTKDWLVYDRPYTKFDAPLTTVYAPFNIPPVKFVVYFIVY